jgi:hypothetical protein
VQSGPGSKAPGGEGGGAGNKGSEGCAFVAEAVMAAMLAKGLGMGQGQGAAGGKGCNPAAASVLAEPAQDRGGCRGWGGERRPGLSCLLG